MPTYTNKINVDLNTKEMEKDFNIFTIAFDSADESTDISKFLDTCKRDIAAVTISHPKREPCYYHIMSKNKSLTIQDVKNVLPKKYASTVVDALKRGNLNNAILINLLLLREINKDNSNSCLINSHIYKIVGSLMSQIITLNIYAKKENEGLYLYADVATFTPYHMLNKKKKEEISSFFKKNMGYMSRVSNDLKNDKDVFVKKQPFNTKNRVNALTEQGNQKTKIKILFDVKKQLQENKYVKSIDFAERHFSEAPNAEKLKKNYHELIKKYENFFKENILQIVYNGSETLTDIQEVFPGIKVKYLTKPQEGLNLVILDNFKQGENEEDDKRYMDDYRSNLLCQHIGLENYRVKVKVKEKDKEKEQKVKNKDEEQNEKFILKCNKEAIAKCLQELQILRDLHNKKISLFNWGIYPEKNKTYTFYGVERKKITKTDYKYFYGSIKIDLYGNILDIRCDTENFFPEGILPDDMSNMKNTFLGAIEDSEGNIIMLENTKEFVMVNNKIFFKLTDYNKKILNTKKTPEEWIEILNKIKNISPEMACGIDEIISGININTKELAFKQIDWKKKIKIKHEVGRYISPDKSISYPVHLRDKDAINEYYETFLGLHFNLLENKYTVAPEITGLGRTHAANTLLKNINVLNGENFFTDLIPTFFVPFVGLRKLTIVPFPFKYLREYIYHSKDYYNTEEYCEPEQKNENS